MEMPRKAVADRRRFLGGILRIIEHKTLSKTSVVYPHKSKRTRMKISTIASFFIIASSCMTASAGSVADAALGGALGRGVGAAVGDTVGGRDGAMVGGADGALLGVAVTTGGRGPGGGGGGGGGGGRGRRGRRRH